MKPQRLRGLPRIRDENIPPSGAAPLKALHQRNKSTPALSTLLQGINANPPKRAAFADVSNTVRTIAAIKDDMILQQKVTVEKVALKSSKESTQEQAPPALQMAKSTALLRPAQRPLSAAIQKSALPPFNEPFASMASKRLAEQSGDANIGKTITKRETTVFKEPEVVGPETHITATIPSVHQVLAAPTDNPLSAREESLKEGVTNEKATHGVSIAPQILQKPNPEPTAEHHEPPSYSETFDGILPPIYSEFQLQPSILEQMDPIRPKSDEIEEFLPALESQIKEIDPILDMKAIPSMIHEIDEYWDDEDDEEYYDAEGYTTARSFRSKGDNTTGGMTIVLAPKVTARVERELAAARVFVESTRTEDDIDDETWDTSMVAEYGEEIFQYMRELEVSQMLPMIVILC
jgi:G2/mitotic-specific cyclin 3/4